MSTTAVKSVPIAVASRQADAGKPDYLARAVALHLAGKREEALKQFQRAIAANEASPEIYRAMGHIQFEMGDYKEAAKTYRLLTQIKPQYAMGWFNLAVSAGAAERVGRGVKSLPQSRQARTRSTAMRTSGLGVCHLRLEDPKSALYSFERCLELSPEQEEAAFGKAAAMQSLGHADEAAAIYENILARNPDPRSHSPTWC